MMVNPAYKNIVSVKPVSISSNLHRPMKSQTMLTFSIPKPLFQLQLKPLELEHKF